MSILSIDSEQRSAASAIPYDRNVSHTLDLSESRTYDCALEILGAYKLTGNFPTELQIVLRELSVLDKVTYEIEPKSPLSDSRHVAFRPNDDVHADRFREIMRSIESRIGSDATLPWCSLLEIVAAVSCCQRENV